MRTDHSKRIPEPWNITITRFAYPDRCVPPRRGRERRLRAGRRHLQSVRTVVPKDVVTRVKDFRDALDELGNEHPLVKQYKIVSEAFNSIVGGNIGNSSKSSLAYLKLRIIAEALNEGWQPNWNDPNEYKYYPVFEYVNKHAGISYTTTNGTTSAVIAHVGSRLCYKTRELATYAGRQFKDIYNELLLY